MKPEPLFYIPVADNDQEVAGPYDLVQMAGLLRRKIITAKTLTLLDGEEDWESFGSRPQFLVAKEMPLDAVSTRSDDSSEAAKGPKPAIPLPSAELLLQVVGMIVGLLLIGVMVYYVSKADVTTGICLAVVGTGISLVGQCMIYVRLMDEDSLTILMVLLVPFFDIYYFLSNFWDYLPYFCAKYIGGMLVAAALAGIASGNSTTASELQSYLHFYGQ